MPARYFSLQEANALLPELEPLMADVLERRAKVARMRGQVAGMLERQGADVGGPAASALVRDFMKIERLVRKIHAYGVVIKDLNAGLLDFLSKRDGREVYLCWRYGEPQVEYFHDLHTGFAGRRHI
ncbi:MAG: DUF2203 domain-containing protein [Candidatus Promineifilaceae bacterium]